VRTEVCAGILFQRIGRADKNLITPITLTRHNKLLTFDFCFVSELTLNPPEGIIAGPINEENFFEWEALIT
jgi:hypothetical protein